MCVCPCHHVDAGACGPGYPTTDVLQSVPSVVETRDVIETYHSSHGAEESRFVRMRISSGHAVSEESRSRTNRDPSRQGRDGMLQSKSPRHQYLTRTNSIKIAPAQAFFWAAPTTKRSALRSGVSPALFPRVRRRKKPVMRRHLLIRLACTTRAHALYVEDKP